MSGPPRLLPPEIISLAVGISAKETAQILYPACMKNY
jgi:hypothetical protein